MRQATWPVALLLAAAVTGCSHATKAAHPARPANASAPASSETPYLVPGQAAGQAAAGHAAGCAPIQKILTPIQQHEAAAATQLKTSTVVADLQDVEQLIWDSTHAPGVSPELAQAETSLAKRVDALNALADSDTLPQQAAYDRDYVAPLMRSLATVSKLCGLSFPRP